MSYWRGGGGLGSHRIVITPGQIDLIIAGFARTWQRPPTEEELKAMVDEYVREEIATREAMAMGLDRDDTYDPASVASKAGISRGRHPLYFLSTNRQ